MFVRKGERERERGGGKGGGGRELYLVVLNTCIACTCTVLHVLYYTIKQYRCHITIK